MITLVAAFLISIQSPDSLYYDIPEVIISSKSINELPLQAVASTSISLRAIENSKIESIKDLSSIAPNFFQPDYGSSMTSSIYMRGFGSRIDQPIVGLNIDEIPCLNKNTYDFDFLDIRKIDILRGPQSTLYGRNTLGGIINIQTLSPLSYSGTRANVSYGNANTFSAKVSHYGKTSSGFGYAAGALYSRTDGFFINEYTGENCDSGNKLSFRVKLEWKTNNRLSISNTSSAGIVNEGGYAYRLYDAESGILNNVNYNDPCDYHRLSVNNGTVIKYRTGKLLLSSITGYQYLNDMMDMDNDFLPDPIFTLKQYQQEHSLSQDFIVRSTDPSAKWQHISGLFMFGKWMDMDAPVTMEREGIDSLILKNANNGIHTAFPDASILIEESALLIGSHFIIPTYGAALYHQSTFTFGKFQLTGGLRLDYEYSSMDYNSNMQVNYMFTMTMPGYKTLNTNFTGKETLSYLELLPKLSLLYGLPEGGNIYLSASKGYKAGGFNTQIFSDILRNKLMKEMMDDLGVHFDNLPQTSYDDATASTYLPEYTWNYELGGHILSVKNLQADFALFYIDCRNQQLTIFPDGNTMGRMMSNAGRSRSFGAEISAAYRYKNFSIAAQYGYTNAKFTDYNNGVEDYSGNFIPYSPQNTVSAAIGYDILFKSNAVLDKISLQCSYSGYGSIYWDESNTLVQPFYGLLSANIALHRNPFTISIWGKNLTNERYNTFYFSSMGNSFFNSGKPLQIGISLSINI